MTVNSEITSLYRNPTTKTIEIMTMSYGFFSVPQSDPNWDTMNRFYNVVRSYSASRRATETFILPDFITATTPEIAELVIEEETPDEPIPEPTKDEKLLAGLTSLIDFFSEFDFTPSYRFTNTLAHLANKIDRVKDYICNYFELMGSSYAVEVSEKVKSKEFEQIVANIAQYGVPDSYVNNRFKVYFGAAGTGKTTLAQTETENRCIVCNSSMLPSDLMENFIFRDGKPDFNPSVLWECMEQGKPIVMDEINLLPFDSLRFLQGIADGKSSFLYKNREVHIKDGFKIIGTMNLTLGGVTYGLPEPLVDRCEDIREFKLSPSQLMGAITGNFVGA